MSHREEVLKRLREAGIPFAYYEHEPVYTMEECLALPCADADVTFCKNILLCNRQKTSYYLYVTLPGKPFRTAQVSKLLGVSRLSFADAEDLTGLLGLYSGSLSPLAKWFDTAQQVQLVLDRAICRDGRIAFHPCDNTATVTFDQSVFRQLVLPQLGSSIWLDTNEQ
jgi:Ala-tRNA(Pro) deacylase